MPSRKRAPTPSSSGVRAAPLRGRTQAVFYRDAKGNEPVDVFLKELLKTQPLAAAKIDDVIEEHLNGRKPDAPPPEFPVTSQIDGELRELRVRFARTRYRLLYERSHNLIVLLHAFEKNTGAVPARDRETAKRRMADFRARMDAGHRHPPRAAGRDAPKSGRG
jgi:phage-related protein